MKPTIGRIVHFVNPYGTGKKIFPAIITNVWSDTCVNLHVFWDGSNYGVPIGASPFVSSVIYDGRPMPDCDLRTWFWPTRE